MDRATAIVRRSANGAHALLAARRGAATVEYGIIVALIVLASFAALSDMAGETTAMWNAIAARVVAAG